MSNTGSKFLGRLLQDNLRGLGTILAVLTLARCVAVGADWVRAGLNTNQPIWGVRGGLLWAIPPGGFRPASGQRGLIRVG